MAQGIIKYAIPGDSQTCNNFRTLCPHASRTQIAKKPGEPVLVGLPLLVGVIGWGIALLTGILSKERGFCKEGRQGQAKAKQTRSAQSSSPDWWDCLEAKTQRGDNLPWSGQITLRKQQVSLKITGARCWKKNVQANRKDATAEEYKIIPQTAGLGPCLRSVWVYFSSK